jgi:type VI secretion system protein ImpG
VFSKGGVISDDVDYEPFYSLRHIDHRAADIKHPGREAYWYASRQLPVDPDDPVTEVSIAFVDSKFDPHLPARNKVTVMATCTNRNLPSRLPSEDGRLEFDVVGPAAVATARCLRRPTPSVPPPLGRRAQWRLISSLALNHLSLTDDARGLEAFRELLEIHNFSKSSTTLQLIRGITRVSGERTSARIGQPGRTAICRGIKVIVEFDESLYVGNSAFLLASVLDQFLSSYASINSFTRLIARSRQPERTIKEWPSRVGDRTLL